MTTTTKTKIKNIKLRVFNIENTSITNDFNDLKGDLLKKLKSTTLKDREMLLNKESPSKETDLRAYYDSYKNCLFGAVIRTKLAAETSQMSDDLMRENKIALSTLKQLSSDSQVVIRSYFFAMSKNYIVANIPGSCNITSFEVYINWLLNRLDNPVRILPKITKVELENIKGFKGLRFKETTTEKGTNTTDVTNDIKVKSVKDVGIEAAKVLFKHLFQGKDNPNLDEIMKENSLTVDFFLKFAPKNKKQNKEIQIAQILKTINTTDGIYIETKKGTIPLGDTEHKIDIQVELTESNFISENELSQKMIEELNDLENNDN